MISFALQLGLERRLFWAALRMSVQLLLVGFVLKWVFADGRLWVVAGVLAAMTVIAGVSAVRRAERTFPGMVFASIVSIWVSAWLISAFALGLILRSDPWYAPQHSVPLTGLILGNSLTGISLALDRFTAELVGKRAESRRCSPSERRAGKPHATRSGSRCAPVSSRCSTRCSSPASLACPG